MRLLRGLLYSLPWVACFLVFVFFLVQRFPLDGQRSFSFSLDGTSPWMDAFLPGQRASTPGPDGQRITDQPVYVSARLPGVFERVVAQFELRTVRQPLLELGIVRRLDPLEAEMQPLWSSVLQTGWREVQVGSQHGFVRESLSDRALIDTPMDRLVTWYATTTPPTLVDASNGSKSWPVNLRGTHDFYFIPVQGEIDFGFVFQNTHRGSQGNTVGFQLLLNDQLLQTDALSLGGERDQRPDQAVEKRLVFRSLAPGLYRLAVTASDDVFMRSMTTNAAHWVVGPRLFLGDTSGWPASSTAVTVWTNSQHVVGQALHPTALQMLSFGSASMAVTSTHQDVLLNRLLEERGRPVSLVAPKGDMRFVGDGFFSFDPNALFLPKPRRLTDASDPLAEGVDAVLTPYHRPMVGADGWVHTSTTFVLPQQVDSYKLTLSAPGLLSRSGVVDIRSAALTYTRQPMDWRTAWTYLRQELAMAWHRL